MSDKNIMHHKINNVIIEHVKYNIQYTIYNISTHKTIADLFKKDYK
jgi:hypothetical protein